MSSEPNGNPAGQHLINSELALAQAAAHKAVLTAAQYAVQL